MCVWGGKGIISSLYGIVVYLSIGICIIIFSEHPSELIEDHKV